MGYLIGIDPVEMLPGCTGMVYLVKVAGVHKGLLRRAELLLIHKGALVTGYRDYIPLAVPGYQLPQPHVARGAQAQKSPVEPALQFHRIPLQHLTVGLAEAGKRAVVLAVGGVFKAVFAYAHSTVQHQLPGAVALQFYYNAALLHIGKGLRRLGIPQVPESHRAVNKADAGHNGRIQSVQPPFFSPAQSAFL